MQRALLGSFLGREELVMGLPSSLHPSSKGLMFVGRRIFRISSYKLSAYAVVSVPHKGESVMQVWCTLLISV
jgi:hypothetical protein